MRNLLFFNQKFIFAVPPAVAFGYGGQAPRGLDRARRSLGVDGSPAQKGVPFCIPSREFPGPHSALATLGPQRLLRSLG